MDHRDVELMMFQFILLFAIYVAGFLHGYAHQKAEAKDE